MPLSSGPPELPTGDCYPARRSATENERSYRLRAGQLALLLPDQAPKVTPLSEASRLRLRFEPTRVQPNRYLCEITFRHGLRYTLSNERYRGFGDFEDQSEDYRHWVRLLIRETAYHAPHCQLITGCHPLLWWFYLALNLVVFGGLIALLLTIGFAYLPIALCKLVALAVFVPLAWKWFRKNRTRSFDPARIPSELLP
ncbi:hypothetical protein ACFSYE_00600 [Roseibacillus ishigakijimensis]